MVRILRVNELSRVEATVIDMDGRYTRAFGSAKRLFIFDPQALLEGLIEAVARESGDVYVFSYETIAAVMMERFGRGYKTKMANFLRIMRALECASGVRIYLVRFSEKAIRNDPEDLALADTPCP